MKVKTKKIMGYEDQEDHIRHYCFDCVQSGEVQLSDLDFEKGLITYEAWVESEEFYLCNI